MEVIINKLQDCVSGLGRFEKYMTGMKRQKVFKELVDETNRNLQDLIKFHYGEYIQDVGDEHEDDKHQG